MSQPAPLPPIRMVLRRLEAAAATERRRAWVAWLAAMAGLGSVLLLAGLEFGAAGSRGGFREDLVPTSQVAAPLAEPAAKTIAASYVPLEQHRQARHRRKPDIASKPAPVEQAYCVRLCDGYFFPLGTVARNASVAPQQSMCSDLCPAAPTRLFTMRAGEDDIGKARSAQGLLYSALPVALRHEHESDATCSCHAPNETALVSLMRDATLRAGDAVVTDGGLRVFRGARHWPYQQADFSTLAQAHATPLARTTLAAIDRLIQRADPSRRPATLASIGQVAPPAGVRAPSSAHVAASDAVVRSRNVVDLLALSE